MRVHRFYVGDSLELKKDFWLHDESILWQWNKVLRFSVGQEIILFDHMKTERLYNLAAIKKTEAHLQLITEYQPKLPPRHIYLFWSLLKSTNNEHILQKCTELGVSNFAPIISARTIKKDFNIERAHKIIIEASEQCGRSNIPAVREPLHLEKALEEYQDKLEFYICEQGSPSKLKLKADKRYGIIIGPEGGWSEAEQKLFSTSSLNHLSLGDFTLRAETAAVVASARLLQ